MTEYDNMQLRLIFFIVSSRNGYGHFFALNMVLGPLLGEQREGLSEVVIWSFFIQEVQVKQLFVLVVLIVIFSGCHPFENPAKLKVVGGQPVLDQNYPFFVSLHSGKSTEPFCGGSLIVEGVVLTAAHCITDTSARISISKGKINLPDIEEVDLQEVKAIIPHPGYDPQRMVHDIALLFLESPQHVSMDSLPEHVRLSLAREPLGWQNGQPLRVIGFGNTTSFGYLFPEKLQEVLLPRVSNEECQRLQPEFIITDGQICAGNVVKGSVDSCQGDSGGPLFSYNENSGSYILEGIVSYGYGCAQEGKPGVYTNVATYHNWILDQVNGYHNPPQNLHQPRVLELIAHNCYDQTSSSIYENGNSLFTQIQLTAPELEIITQEAYEQHGHDILQQCEFNVADNKMVRAKFTKDSDKKFHVFAHVGEDAYYHGIAQPNRSIYGVCHDRSFWTDRQIVSVDGFEGDKSFYGSISSDVPVMADSSTLVYSCQMDDFSLELFQKEDLTYFSTIRFGETVNYAVMIAVDQSMEYLKARVINLSESTALLELINGEQNSMDIFTWKISCPQEFTLRDRHDRIHESAIGADQKYSIEFFYPLDQQNGVIPTMQSKSFILDAKERAISEFDLSQCRVNGMNIRLEQVQL